MLGQRVSEGGKIHLISGNLRFRVPFRPYLALKNEPALSQIVLSTPPVLHETIIRWGLCDIQKNQGRGKGYQPKLKAVANTLTETLIILDITKPQLLIVLFIHWTKKKNEVVFLLLNWLEATQSGRTRNDYTWPWVSFTRLLYNLQFWRHCRLFWKFTGLFRPIRKQSKSFNSFDNWEFWLAVL